MNVLQRLTLRHLKMNKKRTIITVIGIALSVAMITAVSSLVVSFQDMLYRDAVAKDGLWHVRYEGLDRETMAKVTEELVFSHGEVIEEEQSGSVLYLQFNKLHKGIFDESEAVCIQYGIPKESVSYHNNLLIATGIVPGPYYKALYTFAAILLFLVAAGSILVIANAFTISTDQRTWQFGLLKSTGATRKQVKSMVFFEGVVLGAIGIPLGLIAGFAAAGCALAIANYAFDRIAVINFMVRFRIVASFPALAVSIIFAMLTIFLSAWQPAGKAGKISPVEAIRQNSAIKMSRRHVRVFPGTKKIFGFEGLLAAKSMKRSTGRYRTAVISLTVSIVLFIGVSSFGQTLIKATTIVYEDLGSDGVLFLDTDEKKINDQVYTELSGWESVSLSYSRPISTVMPLPDYLKTAMYTERYGDQPISYTIYTLDPVSMEKLNKQGYDFLLEHYDGASPVKGLLVNTTGTIIEQGRRMHFTPFKIPMGTSIDLDFTNVPIEITGEIDFIPTAVHPYFSGKNLNIIVSEEAFFHIKGETYPTDYMVIPVNTDNLTAFEEKTLPYISTVLLSNGFVWVNYKSAMENNRNFVVLVMTFVYGFIAMLSLIAITSVITTISTGVALRQGELAMLRSIGMTDNAMEKMLHYENLIYGLKALIFGIPLGLLASAAMHKAIQSVMDFQYILPIQSILISAAAVFLLTFSAQKYTNSKTKSTGIAESLRNSNI